VAVTAYVLFLLAGVGFGYAAPGRFKLLPLLFPLALALGAAAQEGIDGTLIARLIVALVVTLVGIVLGGLLDQRSAGSDSARYA
jgi:hypothetical protein